MEWMPIETAPKDGTEVLLAGQYKLSRKWDIIKGAYLNYRDMWPFVGENQPTHWMPLPPPPTAHEQIEG